MSEPEDELDEMAEAAANAILALSNNMPDGREFALVVGDQNGDIIICGVGEKVDLLRRALGKIGSGELIESEPPVGEAVPDPELN